MPTRPEDDHTGDDCECPLCKAGVPKSRLIPAELPDVRQGVPKASAVDRATVMIGKLKELFAWVMSPSPEALPPGPSKVPAPKPFEWMNDPEQVKAWLEDDDYPFFNRRDRP